MTYLITLLSSLFFFADDTALTASADTYDELYQLVNSELHKLCHYFRLNKLSLHPDKTKYLLFSFNNTPPPANLLLFLNNNNPNESDPSLISTLSRVTSSDKVPAIKYLGVYFDPNLDFKFHINSISKKLSNALFALRRVKNLLPLNTLKTLYFSLFHCHLIYGIEIWSCISQSTLAPLLTKQKSAIRIISQKSHNSHTEPLFKSLGILPLPDLIKFFNIKFIHSVINQFSPTAFNNTWITTVEQRFRDNNPEIVYNLRNNNDLYIPPSRLKSMARFPLYNLPCLWNSLPEHLRAIPTKQLFKSNLKLYFLSLLSDTVNCNRLFCPSCSNLT